jgi:hypothetical protein
MNKKNLLTILFILALSIFANAQPRGINEFSTGAIMMTANDGTFKGYGALAHYHGSLIDALLNGKNHAFRIGDYFGARLGAGNFIGMIGCDFGVQAAFGTEMFDVGIKYVWKSDLFLGGSLAEGYTLKNMVFSGRIAKIYGEATLGEHYKTGDKAYGAKLRYLFNKRKHVGIEYNYMNDDHNFRDFKTYCLNIGIMF